MSSLSKEAVLVHTALEALALIMRIFQKLPSLKIR